MDKEAKTGGWAEGYTDKAAMVHGYVRKQAKHTSGEEPQGAWNHKQERDMSEISSPNPEALGWRRMYKGHPERLE